MARYWLPTHVWHSQKKLGICIRLKIVSKPNMRMFGCGKSVHDMLPFALLTTSKASWVQDAVVSPLLSLMIAKSIRLWARVVLWQLFLSVIYVYVLSNILSGYYIMWQTIWTLQFLCNIDKMVWMCKQSIPGCFSPPTWLGNKTIWTCKFQGGEGTRF